jgi:peptidoglycan/LPS O-acetylase OafA/YrhL
MPAPLPQPPRPHSSRIPSLDGLRAVSIGGVLLAHASIGFTGSPGGWPHALGERAGSLGVLFFFVISGYLITSLLKREADRTGRIDLVGFYQRRMLRIFPAFYTYLAVIAGLTTAGVLSIAPRELVAAGLHVWNYGGLWIDGTAHGVWFLGHFWTLALEEQFYLLWPLTVVLVGLRRSAAVAVGVCVAAPLLRVACYALFPQARGMIIMMLPTGADALMVGCVAALLESGDRFEQLMHKVAAPAGAALALAALVCVSTPLTVAFRGAYTLPIGRTIDALCVCIIVISMTRHANSLAGRLLNTRPLIHIGVLSYSLYLWQQLFLTSFNTTWTGRLPLSLVCAYSAALCSYLFIERPFLALKQKTHRRRAAVHARPQVDPAAISDSYDAEPGLDRRRSIAAAK